MSADRSDAPQDVTALVREELQALHRYEIPKFEGLRAKLDANESPHPLPADVAEALGRHLGAVALHRYPDGDADALRAVVSADLACAPGQLVFGNGSDELITLLIAAFSRPRPGQPRASVAYPVPSFVVYRIGALAHGVTPLEIPLAADFTLDAAAVDRGLTTGRPNVLFLAMPNNPTGTLWPRAAVVQLLERHPDVLIVSDEAYFDYAGETLLDLLPRHPNLIVMRTLSKIGLAGLRCGFLVADPAIVAELEKIRPPYNLGGLNQAAAAWLLQHHGALLRGHVQAIVAERERVAAALAALPSLTVFPSRANFLLFRHAAATALWQRLITRGVLLRNFDRGGAGPLAGCLRVTIGTPAENDIFLEAMRT